jgi:hypothetical protein
MAFYKDQIYVGQSGEMVIQIFRNESTSNISKKFQTQKTPEPLKTFSNLASGKIEKGDKILISTSDISEIITGSMIKELMSRHTTEKLYNYLKNELGKINSLACLLLQAETQLPQEAVAKEEISSTIEFTIDFKEILNNRAEKINQSIKNQLTFLNKFILFIINHHTIKYLCTLTIILVLILSPYLIEKVNYEIKIRKINSLILRIEENNLRSEAALTYQNQLEARIFLEQTNQLLNAADSLFEKLPGAAREKIFPDLQNAKNRFEAQNNTLNNIIKITKIERIADLTKNAYSFNPKGILQFNNKLYLYELNSGCLYEIDLVDHKSRLVFLSSEETFKMGTVLEEEIFLLNSPERISVYDLAEDYNLYLLKPNLENTLNIKDMTNFRGDIFFLDAEKKTIWKYVLSGDILNGTNWISADELKNSQSMAVDGNIFVSQNDGVIKVYSPNKKNKEIRFEIIPPINQGGKLFTREWMKNLYVLDALHNRIICYNKQDGLVKQFSIPTLSNLRDFWIESDERTIYLLNGLEVYKIEI